MNQPTPLASGEMKNTPLGGLLYSIHAKSLTGSLVLAESEQRIHCVAFRNGYPFKARLADSVDMIGELLVSAGSLPAEQLQTVINQASASSELFGQAAIAMGLLTPEALTQGLVFQTLRRVARLFALQSGTYGFYREDFLANFGDADSPPVDPFAIISAGARSYYNGERLASLVASLGSQEISTELDFEALQRFRFNDDEHMVAMMLSVPQKLIELIAVSGQPPSVSHLVVHCLQMTGQLVLEEPDDATLPEASAFSAEASENTATDAEAQVAQNSTEPAPPIATPMSNPAQSAQPAPPIAAPVSNPAQSAQPAPPIAAPVSNPAQSAQPAPPIASPMSSPAQSAQPAPPIATPTSSPAQSAQPAPPIAAPTSSPAQSAQPAPSSPRSTPPPTQSSTPSTSSEPQGPKKRRKPKSSAKPEIPEYTGSEPKSERRIEAETLIEKGDDATYFELLGVTPEASSSELQKAYIKQARKFHPDRATGDLTDLRPFMADLFARISAAHQELKDPEKRKEYESKLNFKQEYGEQVGEGGAPIREEEIVQRILAADEAFMKAKILLRRNKLDEAEELARSAVEANEEQGDYAALLAWIEARRRKRTQDVSDLIERISAAVKLVPKSEDAHFYLAELLYRSGRSKEALQAYEAVMELNEHNIDATRMVRILRKKRQEQAAKKKSSAKNTGGFFGSLFGDSKKK